MLLVGTFNSTPHGSEVVAVKSYVFHADLAQEEDGRWSAWVEALPGCATWGYSKEEALEALREGVQAYIEVLLESGQPIPVAEGVEVRDDAAVIAVV
ncbi:MAG: type II toxin-antitoxin system HicB family antitoxin [Candidatus Tectomicrobia bacterium]|nr:type II toxin-antitoxin system HicB family antitoxin [Candidatus Tectomicrobia bacterium]